MLKVVLTLLGFSSFAHSSSSYFPFAAACFTISLAPRDLSRLSSFLDLSTVSCARFLGFFQKKLSASSISSSLRPGLLAEILWAHDSSLFGIFDAPNGVHLRLMLSRLHSLAFHDKVSFSTSDLERHERIHKYITVRNNPVHSLKNNKSVFNLR